MRKTSAIGFVATIAIAVPAGWHLLGADLNKDGKLVRPLEGIAKIDADTLVSIDADHAIAAPGARVKVTLVATSDRPHPVPVEMTVMIEGSVGPEERVPAPLEAIDRERFVLPAGPGGGKPVETYVTLGHKVRYKGASEIYRIFVAPPKGQLPSNQSDLDPDPERRQFAGIGVLTWSGNKLPLSIEAPKTVDKDKPFQVSIHLKNTSNHTLHYAWFELGSQITVRGIGEHSEDVEIERDDTDTKIELAPGQSTSRTFTITSKRDAPISLLARAYVYEKPPMGPGEDVGWEGGAMDVVRIAVGTPAVAAN
jgi:hypothetical protein